MFGLWFIHIKFSLYGNFDENMAKKFLKLSDYLTICLTKMGKTWCQKWRWIWKIWKNEFDFWIVHIKIRLYVSFHENLRIHFWLIEEKMKMKMKACGKMSPIFEFFISKLGCKEIFMKIWEKSFWLIFLIIFDLSRRKWK